MYIHATNYTGSSALDQTFSPTVSGGFRIHQISIHLSAAPTTPENWVVKLNSKHGAAYDTIIRSIDFSDGSITNYVFVPEHPIVFHRDDELDLDWTNTDGSTYGIVIVWSEL